MYVYVNLYIYIYMYIYIYLRLSGDTIAVTELHSKLYFVAHDQAPLPVIIDRNDTGVTWNTRYVIIH
jgi:hypothetical protein